MELEIIYHDEQIIAINKPHGLLVHRSKYANEAKTYALQELRNQIGQYVYPGHRIDRKTGGILLFGLNAEMGTTIQKLFAANEIKKTYLAIVRGHTNDEGIIDYPLTNDDGKTQEAITWYKTEKRCELDVPFGHFQTSRYSLLTVTPQNGRMHQIRKHLAHIFHPIIGDRPHGCNKQNKLFKEKWGMDTMMLHAQKLEFTHPANGNNIIITANLQSEFLRMIQLMGW